MFKWLSDFFWAAPRASAAAPPPELRCDDCGVGEGELHDLFCTREQCPFCGLQLITCDCQVSVQQLTSDEENVLEEYIDDSVEPLRSIMERWRVALEKKGRVPFVPLVFEKNADGLILAAGKGYIDLCRRLLAEGVDVNSRNVVGHTALMAASRNLQVEGVQLLIVEGADATLQNQYGHSSLHCAVGEPSRGEEAERRQVGVIEQLLGNGAVLDAKDEAGGTALMDAAWFGCEAAVQALVRAGASTGIRDKEGRSAVDLAHQRGHHSIASLLERG